MSGFQYGVKSIWQTHPTSLDVLRDSIALRLSASETAAKMAAQFGMAVTANVCIGKARRLGIKFDSANNHNTFAKHGRGPARPSRAVPRAPKPEKLQKTVFYPRPEPVDFPAEPVAITASRRVSLDELTFNSCRWPLGDPRDDEDFAFCGADRVDSYDASNAYCAHHAAIAYTPRATRKITPEHRRAMLAGKIKAQLVGVR